jgi:hypothetical protein
LPFCSIVYYLQKTVIRFHYLWIALLITAHLSEFHPVRNKKRKSMTKLKN